MIIKCDACGKEFYRRPSRVARAKRHYCSQKCTITGKDLPCAECGKTVHREINQLNNRRNIFCSQKCLRKYYLTRVIVKCSFCDSDIIRPNVEVKCNKTGLYFCNMRCKSDYYHARNMVKCLCCGKPFYKGGAEIKRYPKHFCSLKCVNGYWFGESFPEKEFEKLVKDLSVKYIKHDRSVIPNLELDFWFPDIKYAVEINGRQHYEPIYGEDSLAAQKIRDKQKRLRCKNIGIKLRAVKPGNCKTNTYLPRFKRVIWEIKKLINNAAT